MGMNINMPSKRHSKFVVPQEGLEIVSVTKSKIDKATEKRLNELTYDVGMMWPAYLATQGEKYHRIFIAKFNGKIVGWAMTYWACPEELQNYRYGAATGFSAEHYKKTNKYFHVYVSRNHRKMGIGKALWEKAATSTVSVFPHDGTSKAFFNAMKKGV